MTIPDDRYTHGHDEAVLAAHGRRTVADSAGYLVPHLAPGARVLDVGCGPGSITVGLADLVVPGEVIGVDRSPSVVDLARGLVEGRTNLRFDTADVYALPFDDGSFDVVHAHQVLQHLSDPVAALRELRRVAVPGGLVAVRDADYGAMTWHPVCAGVADWRAVYRRVARANHGEPDAGRRLLGWALAAGFAAADLTPGADAWCFATPADRAWWSTTWAQRTAAGAFADRAMELGLADEAGLGRVADAWRVWAQAPDGWFLVPHGYLLARVP